MVMDVDSQQPISKTNYVKRTVALSPEKELRLNEIGFVWSTYEFPGVPASTNHGSS
jgi:hypothetical protein